MMFKTSFRDINFVYNRYKFTAVNVQNKNTYKFFSSFSSFIYQTDYIASNDKMPIEKFTGKYVERKSCGLISRTILEYA
jgi:hypothetical protein